MTRPSLFLVGLMSLTVASVALADSVPPKPALVHCADGAAIKVEVYELGVAEFGSFVVEVPPPLAIGTVTLSDGTSVKGFVAEQERLFAATWSFVAHGSQLPKPGSYVTLDLAGRPLLVLREADDAWVIDTSDLTVDQIVDVILERLG